jgi:hypothetical protein
MAGGTQVCSLHWNRQLELHDIDLIIATGGSHACFDI